MGKILKISTIASITLTLLLEVAALGFELSALRMLDGDPFRLLTSAILERWRDITIIRQWYTDALALAYICHFLGKWMFCATVLQTLLLIAHRLKK